MKKEVGYEEEEKEEGNSQYAVLGARRAGKSDMHTATHHAVTITNRIHFCGKPCIIIYSLILSLMKLYFVI